MIPAWKLKREVQRLAQQASAIPLLAYEPFLQFFYDRNLHENLSLHSGCKSFGKSLAVFLVYQPGGLAESAYLTIDHLVESGFDPVVVSNCVLQKSDIERLKSNTALIIERKNFGYDFGGYRDAIFVLLRKYHVKCDQILFLNDSVWFPIFNASSMLEEMIESDASYVGTQAFGEWCGDTFDGFFGSYCFMIKAPLLYGEKFNEFWSNYKLSSSKEVVLRRGERRFSRVMLEASEKSHAIYSLERFLGILGLMTYDEIAQALQDLIVWDGVMALRKSDLLSARVRNEKWCLDAMNLISMLSKTKNFIGSSPVFSLTHLGFPMIKKNNEMLYVMARKRIIDAIDSGRVEGINVVVERELRQKVLSNFEG